jgi:hypothetical protein
MIAHRFKSRNPSVPTPLAETGHRHSNPPKREDRGLAPSPEPSGQSPPASARPIRNAERIAADRQKITDSGLLDLLLDHVRDQKQLSPSQISTAFGLLKKILPDFSNSAPPRDNEEAHEDSISCDPEFEIHIVDPQEG